MTQLGHRDSLLRQKEKLWDWDLQQRDIKTVPIFHTQDLLTLEKSWHRPLESIWSACKDLVKDTPLTRDISNKDIFHGKTFSPLLNAY